jgi:hypothetical protein
MVASGRIPPAASQHRNRAHHIGAANGGKAPHGVCESSQDDAGARPTEPTQPHLPGGADASAAMRGLSAKGDLQKFTKMIGCEMPVAEANIFVGL